MEHVKNSYLQIQHGQPDNTDGQTPSVPLNNGGLLFEIIAESVYVLKIYLYRVIYSEDSEAL